MVFDQNHEDIFSQHDFDRRSGSDRYMARACVICSAALQRSRRRNLQPRGPNLGGGWLASALGCRYLWLLVVMGEFPST